MDVLKVELLEIMTELDPDYDEAAKSIYEFAIEQAVISILSYCNLSIDEWPSELNNTAVLISMDLINQVDASLKADGDGDVTSIKEGDFSITKESRLAGLARLANQPSFVRKYAPTLVRYRKLAK